MTFDTHSLEAYSTVLTAPSPATSGTSLVVQSGNGTLFHIGQNATVFPAGAQPTTANSEIVRITGISTDSLTITRTQEGSSARSIVVGDQIANTITPKVLTDIEGYTHPIGAIIDYAARVAPTGWLNCDGSAVSRSTYAPLFAVLAATLGSITVTSATPAVVTNNGHGLSTGDAIYLTGTAPTGTSINTLYYIVRVDANSYNLSTTRANAYAATKIATSSTGSGLTAYDCPHGLGDGSTTFTLPDSRGRTVAGMDTTGGTAAGRLNLSQSQGVYGNLGATGGEQGHQITTTEMPSHIHTYPGSAVGAAGSSFTSIVANTNTPTSTSASGSDVAHNNIAPIQLVNRIIKT